MVGGFDLAHRLTDIWKFKYIKINALIFIQKINCKTIFPFFIILLLFNLHLLKFFFCTFVLNCCVKIKSILFIWYRVLYLKKNIRPKYEQIENTNTTFFYHFLILRMLKCIFFTTILKYKYFYFLSEWWYHQSF